VEGRLPPKSQYFNIVGAPWASPIIATLLGSIIFSEAISGVMRITKEVLRRPDVMVTSVLRRCLLLVVLLTFAGTAHAQPLFRVEGSVYAPSSCALRANWREVLCTQYIAPVKTQILARSGTKTYRLSSDSDGNLSGTLPRGRYSLRVGRINHRGQELSARNYIVAPQRLRIAGHTTIVLAVVHR
jgi:hypothetical protein